ncbi:hypothetical protein Y900_003270 [Mycolicibacterium aromaticivorans JS19b1 = JCM 16368]|uniref:GH16 domain-containing protein n=1 Tax=Mycolicibacterium aromaticivorans JS19b1 = JCM 16368 TaxID=1440774 RepID=A0A064CCA7_9MYCO|nr:hypothetical protein Y900_003270 [Mycolicibacterium aromaticivorans JS19b1 = JCM 16368]
MGGALMAFGVGASITVGCGVAAADDGSSSSASASTSKSVVAHTKPSSHTSAVSRPQAKKPVAAAAATGRRVAAQVQTQAQVTASALAAAQPSAAARAAKSASAVGNPLGFLNVMARQIQVTFFNRTPTIYYDASKNVINDDGTISGQVIGSDADGDTLKYTVSTAADGTVKVDTSGRFTYTPGADFVPASGDLFTASVSDAMAGRYHGLMGLLVPGWGSTASLVAKVTGTIPLPGDPGGAGTWGTPTRSTFFTDSSVLSDWWVYNGRTQHGNRTPNQISFADGVMTLSGDAAGNDAGIAWGPGQKYGAWEVRVKIPAGAPNYDPVLLLWPDAENWPTGGEIDFMEIWGDGSRQAVNSVLHYSSTNQQDGATMPVDATQWHTYAVKWTPSEITTYVDGTTIFTTKDTSMFPPGPMHLAIQLDMLGPDISAGAKMMVAWVKEYSLASVL